MVARSDPLSSAPSTDMLMAAAPLPGPTVPPHCPSRAVPPRAVPPRDVRCDPSPPRPRMATGGAVTVAPSQVVRSEEPPLLRETPPNLAYRGEGADHIVLRLLGSGQVLRLRKTAVGGGVTSRKDLLLRAARDEHFLQNVARPILGPLLTDESRLVILDPDTLAALRDTLQARRQGHRQHKEINRHGVACICPDAASIFIERHDTSSCTSSPPLPSPLPRPPAAPSSPPFTARHGPPPHQRVRFATSAPPAGPQATNGAANLKHSPSQTSTNMSRRAGTFLQEDIASRISPRDRVVENDTKARKTPPSAAGLDSELGTTTPLSAAGVDSVLDTTPEVPEPKNVCIEIKPKQGFLDYSTPDLPLCRYCVKQFLKRAKDGQTRSRYCPLDLFSGDLDRMRSAVEGLIQSPQNNFKVFLEGEPVEDCKPFSYLRDVIISAMTFDFASSSAGVPQGRRSLSPRSPLGRILAFQTLDQLGVFRATRLYHALVRRVGSCRATDVILQDLSCWSRDSHHLQPVREELRCDPEQQHASLDHTSTRKRKHRLLKNGSRKAMTSESQVKMVTENVMAVNHVKENDVNLTNAETWKVFHENGEMAAVDDGKHLGGDDEDEEDGSLEDMVRSLQKYLLSTTAKDLSLMILLSGPHTSAPPPCAAANTSPFTIALEAGLWYKCQVTGVDLVAKPSSKILKHERDYQQLKDVLLDLRSRGEEPPCCRL